MQPIPRKIDTRLTARQLLPIVLVRAAVNPHHPGMPFVHATTVALSGRAVLIRGPSGSGKSDLALRLVDEGAMLVADDQTGLTVENGRLMARPPPTIAGLLEVRGLGIVRLPYHLAAPVVLVADLAETVERLPPEETVDLLGMAIPRVSLRPFEASATAKLRLAVSQAGEGGFSRCCATRWPGR